MRQLIENPVYMTYDEIVKNFDGRWVLITKCDYTPHQRLIGGVPVATADKIFEGQRDGFYDQFFTPEYSPRTNINFNYEPMLPFYYFLGDEETDGDDDDDDTDIT